MTSPFPGMDPWLERPAFWPDVHDNLIVTLQRALASLVGPRYYVAIKQRMVFAVAPAEPALIIPDVAVMEREVLSGGYASPKQAVLAEPIIVEVPVREKIPEDYLEIIEAATEHVVTIVEILSLSNKLPGKDRRAYERKRERIFQTPVHLVEIDLLRDGEPLPYTLFQTNGHWKHYRIFVKRGDRRRAHLYPFDVRDSIPVFPLPLQPGDGEPPIRLGELLKQVYEECKYYRRIVYSRSPEPPLSDADAQWAAGILRAKR